MEKNYFQILNQINVADKVEKKNGLSYLSWAWAWAELKKLHPNALYTIYENAQGWNYHTDGRTAWVKTGVTVEGIEHIEYLPVMNLRNASIPLETLTSTDVNKTIQRSLTKAVARHGMGLFIYAGEDLPESDDGKPQIKETRPQDVPTANPNEKIRPSVVIQIEQNMSTLSEEDRMKVGAYLAKYGASKVSDLTQPQGQALLVNLLSRGGAK
jgi:hypothetical protein